jgi:hypothetical protein
MLLGIGAGSGGQLRGGARAAAIGLTALVADRGIAAWWVMVVSVIAVLLGTMWRGAR